jgi:predicted protein tyrosine phosphatase
MIKILFVCAQNKLRSPTAENIFSIYKNIECTSAGIHESADNPLNKETVEWADIIFTMERKHRTKIQQKFRQSLNGKKIISLEIPDKFQYMEPTLIELLTVKVTPHIKTYL